MAKFVTICMCKLQSETQAVHSHESLETIVLFFSVHLIFIYLFTGVFQRFLNQQRIQKNLLPRMV